MTVNSFLAEAMPAQQAGDVLATEAIYRRYAAGLGPADSIEAGQAAAVLYDLGIDLAEQWRIDAAEEVFRRSIALYRIAGNPTMEAAANNRLGIVRLENGWLAEARECFERALALRTQLLAAQDGSDNAVYRGGVLCNLGNAAAAAFDFPAASALFAHAEAALLDAVAHGADRQTADRFLANTRSGAQRSAGRPSTPLDGMFDEATKGVAPDARGCSPWIDALMSEPDPAAVAHHVAATEPGTVGGQVCRGLLAGGFIGDGWLAFDEVAAGEAVASFDAAIELAPDDLAIRLLKARALARWAAACQARWRCLIEAATSRMGREDGEQLVDPVLRRFRGCWQRARESYLQALRVAPHSAATWLEYGCFLREMTSHVEEDAVDAFQRALAIDPGLELARAQLASPEA
ncbi:MAG TPA: tetratricopeptide repeat protein [Kofleriaceae bacterium]|nr:tetratricopeptide repeat protein [Kofleriaceae bacterium]